MGNVTIYLPDEIIARCRAAALEDQRSLSNYLAGLLQRAHPFQVGGPEDRANVAREEAAMAGVVSRGRGVTTKMAKHK